MDVPFVVYADFECILQDINTPENNSKSTVYTKKHIPCAFSYYIKCSFSDTLNKFRSYQGEDSSVKFIEYLSEDVKNLCRNHLHVNLPMNPLTNEEKIAFRNTNICHICDKIINSYEQKAHDHCHLTGQYRGVAHMNCNKDFQVPNFIPIIFHNFSNYDCHLFIKDLDAIDNGANKIDVIPINKEVYFSISKSIDVDDKKVQLRFIDSIKFMASSLDSLVNNLKKEDFKIVQSQFNNTEESDLLLRKGVFPYEYMDSFDRMDETSLPSREQLFNKLNNTECSIEDYAHAQKVWNTFNCQTLKDYLMLYLKTMLYLLLADVFENFRKVCKRIFKLDACHYYTAPGLSWDAMLKYTQVN